MLYRGYRIRNLTVLGETRGGTMGGAPNKAKFLPDVGSKENTLNFNMGQTRKNNVPTDWNA